MSSEAGWYSLSIHPPKLVGVAVPTLSARVSASTPALSVDCTMPVATPRISINGGSVGQMPT